MEYIIFRETRDVLKTLGNWLLVQVLLNLTKLEQLSEIYFFFLFHVGELCQWY